MAVSTRDRVMLWGRAGNRCSHPECREPLVVDGSSNGTRALIGEVVHIVASSPDGPRGSAEYPEGKLDSYDNLILLCRNHHRIVDQQADTYSVETLHELKAQHEDWVRTSLEDHDSADQRVKERYAAIVDGWSRRCRLDDWDVWTSYLLSPDPSIEIGLFEQLDDLGPWLLQRVWPERYPELEESFVNFRLVLQSLLRTFSEHRKESGDRYWVPRFYQISEWDPERYERLAKEFEQHVDLLHDLVLELTRAANLVCERVRECLDPAFRLEEGVLLVEYMTSIVDPVRHLRVEYTDDEKTERPYPGLEPFRTGERFERDFHFGEMPGE